jgi:FixJ family two-component response regulator
MKTGGILVCVVDDDDSVRESLPDLLHEFGLTSKAFARASDYLQSALVDKTKCLIPDVAMPEMSGPELRGELLRQGYAEHKGDTHTDRDAFFLHGLSSFMRPINCCGH